jgi:hypothetical protein
MKRSAIVLIFIFFHALLVAQVVPDLAKITHPLGKRELSVVAGPVYTNIQNANLKNDKYASTRGTISPNMGINYYLPFDKYIGYGAGIEFSRYTNITDYKGYFRYPQTRIDNAGYLYYPLVEANYSNTITLTSIDMPLTLRFHAPIAKNLELFIDGGMKVNAVLSYEMVRSGIYNTKGLYPLRNGGNSVYELVENTPSLGYVNTTYNHNVTTIPTSKVGLGVIGTIGLKAETSDRLFWTFHFLYFKGLNDLNSESESSYVNIFGDKSPHSKYTALQMGLRVGLGFNIY